MSAFIKKYWSALIVWILGVPASYFLGRYQTSIERSDYIAMAAVGWAILFFALGLILFQLSKNNNKQ